jgi:membrane protein YdbS with pleckstrin-like domain
MNFTLRPVFVGWALLLAQLPLQVFLAVWAAGFFGIICAIVPSLLTGFEEEPQFGFLSFLLCGVIALIAVPLIIYVGKKMNYARTEYRFFSDRLEFAEGFLTIVKKVVRFTDVKEVSLRRGVLQRMCGLGTVYLATQATGAPQEGNPFSPLRFGSVSTSGIVVRNIPDPEKNYERIRDLIAAKA